VECSIENVQVVQRRKERETAVRFDFGYASRSPSDVVSRTKLASPLRTRNHSTSSRNRARTLESPSRNPRRPLTPNLSKRMSKISVRTKNDGYPILVERRRAEMLKLKSLPIHLARLLEGRGRRESQERGKSDLVAMFRSFERMIRGDTEMQPIL